MRKSTYRFIISVILIAVSSCMTVNSADSEQLKWSNRVIPLPKEISVVESVNLPAKKILLHKLNSNAIQIKTAENLIKKFARNVDGKPELTVKMILTDSASSKVNKKILDKLTSVKNQDQAYAIMAAPEEKTITLLANQPVGLLYAARTLFQLVKPSENLTAEKNIEVPYVNVLDWPDMEERGVWGVTFVTMPFLASYKMNMLETNARPGCDENGNLFVGIDEKLIRDAAAEGVRLITFISHIGRAAKSILHRSKNNPKIKKMYESACGPKVDHGYFGSHQGFCMNSEMTEKIITEWLRQIAAKIYPYHHELEIWFSEGEKPCPCPECKDKNPYLLELKCLYKAFENVKQDYPKLRLRLWLSQGSFRYDNSNDKIIAALPKGVGLGYYHGQKTYLTDYKPMVPEYLKNFSEKGGWVGIVPSIGANMRTYIPFTSPQFVHFRITEFVDKKLDSMSLYVPPSAYHYEFNMLAAAEWSWNSKGRTIEEFAVAYAIQKGIAKPALFAEWATKIGKVNFDLAEQPNGGTVFQILLITRRFQKNKYYLESLKDGKLNNPDTLHQDLADAQKALTIAKTLNNPLMIYETEYSFNMLKAYSLLDSMSKSLLDKKSTPDLKKLQEQADELDQTANALRKNLIKWWNKMATDPRINLPPPRKNEGNADYPYMYPRTRNMTYALTRICDDVRKILAKYQIKDPRPETRQKLFGEWKIDEFKRGYTGKNYDITKLLDPSGGLYQVIFEFTKGYPIRVVSVKLLEQKPGAKDKKVVFVSPDIWTTVRGAGRHKHVEHRIKVLPFGKGTSFFLKIRLCVGVKGMVRNFPDNVPEDRRFCSGVIGLRKVPD